jgi:hypothetical protein
VSEANRNSPESVFLNVPYDEAFEGLYLAYLAALPFFGLIPRAALEITESRHRLEKIIDLIESCPYSLHDLSRVQLDRKPPPTPRFNMPFELGIAVATARIGHSHRWFVLEEKSFRLQKSLSDLNGIDPFIHHARPIEVLTQICNIFTHVGGQPSMPRIWQAYCDLETLVPELKRESGATSVYEPRIYNALVLAAQKLANRTAKTVAGRSDS